MLSRFHVIPERHGQTDKIAISTRQYLQNCTIPILNFQLTFAYHRRNSETWWCTEDNIGRRPTLRYRGGKVLQRYGVIMWLRCWRSPISSSDEFLSCQFSCYFCNVVSFRLSIFFFFFQITTQLQYIEDSEPVVDGSRNWWCAVQWATKTNYKQQKTKATTVFIVFLVF